MTSTDQGPLTRWKLFGKFSMPIEASFYCTKLGFVVWRFLDTKNVQNSPDLTPLWEITRPGIYPGLRSRSDRRGKYWRSGKYRLGVGNVNRHSLDLRSINPKNVVSEHTYILALLVSSPFSTTFMDPSPSTVGCFAGIFKRTSRRKSTFPVKPKDKVEESRNIPSNNESSKVSRS